MGRLICLFGFSVLLSACHNMKHQSAIEDFDKFYKKFHSDSLFQLSRIDFPLEGLPAFAEEQFFEEGSFEWQKESWDLHREINYKEFPDINVEIVRKEAEVTEFVDMGSGFGLERRFELRKQQWFLVYYVGMNRLKK